MKRKLKRPRLVNLKDGRFIVLSDRSRRVDPIDLEPLKPIEPEPLEPITDYDLITQPADPSIRYISLSNLGVPGEQPPVAIVDAEDFERVKVHTWTGVTKGTKTRAYARFPENSTCQMSRFILGVITDSTVRIHFRNRNPLDNRKQNLEVRKS